LFKPNGASFPHVPQQPSKDDAAAALTVLKDLIVSFPFVTSADRSVALSAMLTPLDRHAMETAPLHTFSSPAAGTGKSLLVDIAATLATGRHMQRGELAVCREEHERNLAKTRRELDEQIQRERSAWDRELAQRQAEVEGMEREAMRRREFPPRTGMRLRMRCNCCRAVNGVRELESVGCVHSGQVAVELCECGCAWP
jgi:hypothetical protein